MIHLISENYVAASGDHIHIPFWKKHNITEALLSKYVSNVYCEKGMRKNKYHVVISYKGVKTLIKE